MKHSTLHVDCKQLIQPFLSGLSLKDMKLKMWAKQLLGQYLYTHSIRPYLCNLNHNHLILSYRLKKIILYMNIYDSSLQGISSNRRRWQRSDSKQLLSFIIITCIYLFILILVAEKPYYKTVLGYGYTADISQGFATWINHPWIWVLHQMS